MNIFSQRLKQLRTDAGKNQIDIANYLGVSVQSYSAYETGREPKYELLCKLADYFDCPVDYLLGRSDIQSPNINDMAINERFGLGKESIKNLEYGLNNYANYKDIVDKFIGHEKFPSFINCIITHINNKNKFATKSLKKQFMDLLSANRSVHSEIFDYVSDPENIIDGSARKIERVVNSLIDDLVEKEAAKGGDNNAETQNNP